MRADARRDLNLIVFLSNRCNLQCGYCAVEVNAGEALRLDAERLRAGIGCYLDECEGRKSVTLLGGEPLLDLPLVSAAADFVRDEERRRGEPIRISVYTNGTLLTHERLSALRARGVSVWLSLDGRAESNDHHRVFRAGRRSVSAAVTARLDRLDVRQLRANMVVHADTARHLVRDAAWFETRGFPVVNFHPELWECWTPSRLAELKGALDGFSRWYRARWRALGRPPFELPILSLLLDRAPGVSAGEPWWERCDNLVLGPDGGFRACERDLSDGDALNDARLVGDPSSGVDWEKKEALLEASRRLLRRRGAKREWHHACPKGLVMLAQRRGWDPERLLDSFQDVSRVFGEGMTRIAEEARDLPGFTELYPGAGRLRARRRRPAAPSALDLYLDAGASLESAAAHGLAAVAITRFWEHDARGSEGLAALWRRFQPAAPERAAPRPRDAASRLVLRGLRRLAPAGALPGRPGRTSRSDWEAALAADPLCAWAALLLGVDALSDRRLDEAVSRLTHAAELRPRWAWPRIVRAWSFHLLGRQAEAGADLKEAARLEPGSAWPDALRASADAGKDAGATMVSCLDAAVRRQRAAWTLAWRGFARLRAADARGAARDLSAAVRRDANLGRAWTWLGEARAAAGLPLPAEAALSRAIALSPTMPTAFLARARARLERGDGAGGVADLEAMLALHRRYEWETNWYNARYLHREREWGGLLGAAGLAMRLAPRSFVPHLVVGLAALCRRDYPAAEASFARAAALRVSRVWAPWLSLWRGLALSRLDRGPQARLALEAATGSASARAGAELSSLALREGRAAEALRAAEAAVARDPLMSEAWRALACARLARGDESGALEALDRLRALEPMMAWAGEWSGRLAARLGRWREAHDALKGLPHPDARALAAARAKSVGAGALPAAGEADAEGGLDASWVLDDASAGPPPPEQRLADGAPRLPPDPGPFLARARAACAAGDFATALAQARWTLEESIFDPLSAEGLLLEARALAGLGRPGLALTRLEFAASLRPRSPWPRALAARLRASMGDGAGARRDLGLALRAAPGHRALRAYAAALLAREPALRGAA